MTSDYIGYCYKTYVEHIRVSNRRRTRLRHHVIDPCLVGIGAVVFYTYNDIDIRWFKRRADVWDA